MQQARELLAPVYGWFTEGFDTRDLKEARPTWDTAQVTLSEHYRPQKKKSHYLSDLEGPQSSLVLPTIESVVDQLLDHKQAPHVRLIK